MKTAKLTWAFIALLLTLASCKRDNPLNNQQQTENPETEVHIKTKDLVVPAGFNFETEKNLSIKVGVANPAPGQRYVIKIYANVPSTGALITSGITNTSAEYTANVRVPAWQEYIFIEKINADGSSQYEKVKANQFVKALFNGQPNAGTYIFRKSGSGMSCSSGCSSTSNNRSSGLTVNSGQTVCLTGTFGAKINITVKSGGTLKICASGSLNDVKVQGTGKLYILENANISMDVLRLEHADATVKNWSDSVIVKDEFYVKGYFENNGRVYTTNTKTEITSEGVFKNYNIFKTQSSSTTYAGDIWAYGKFYNYHFTFVGGNYYAKSGGETYNYCMLNAENYYYNWGYTWNNCFIKVLNTFSANSSSEMDIDNGGILSVKNLYLENDITGTGTNRSKVKVTHNTTITSSGDIDGKIDFCDSNGIESNTGQINSPAALSCSGYIAPSTCFPDGFGTPPVADSDNDGVPDTQDEYPNDADRAFNKYYPSANSTATIAYEDLWPATGDYDFNDLVLSMNIHQILNADNKVVDYKVKLKVKAVGAAFDNGFGFQFDELAPGDIQSVTGQSFIRNIISKGANGAELGQSKAVIIAYDSPEPSMHRALGSMFNTIKANSLGTSDTMRINVTFTAPIVESKLEIDKFNPFIFANQQRGTEIHLGNFIPTSLATTSLFGTQQDGSNPGNGIYYKNPNGMPWAIMLPVDFDYPSEKTDVTDAYNYFDDWAVSGGSNHTDWYTNNPGNRNAENIFVAN